jgi:DNA-binding IclR family transcriptional regulator
MLNNFPLDGVAAPYFLLQSGESGREGEVMSGAATPSAPAVERTLSILELLSVTRSGLTLPELSRRLGLPKSSTYCLLVTLERRGYLLRNNRTHRYMFGLKLFSLANMALSGIELRENATSFLRPLMQRSCLTVHMAIIENHEAVLIEKVEPPGLFRLATWVGKRLELHCSAVGKCLLAYLPEAEFVRLVRDRGLTRNNENTITSVRKLKQQMAQIRHAGYAIEDEEGEIGCRCVGAPVFDHSGRAIAAISVAGTTAQITSEEFSYFGQLVRQTASDISQALGFIPPATAASRQGWGGEASPATARSAY